MNYTRKIYRYILNGIVNLNEPIANYKIIAQNKFPNQEDYPIAQAVRFLLPNDLKLKPQKGTSYSTTEDTRTLADLQAHLVIRINGRWKEDPLGLSLSNTQPHKIHMEMLRKGYFITEFGYLNKERYLYYNYQYPQLQTDEDKTSIWTFEKYFHKQEKKHE